MNLNKLDSPPSRSPGFSISDLLITVAVVALLVVSQLAASTRGSSNSPAEACRNNLRQLIQAWQMYGDNSSGKLAPGNGSHPGVIGTWVRGWLDYRSSYDNINTGHLVDFNDTGTYGHLGPYLKSPNVFRCPSDYSTTVIFGEHHTRVRSVSMNNWMGGNVYCAQNQFRIYRRFDDVAKPAQRFVILDERADSINDSLLLVDMVDRFVDFPGFYHQGGTWVTYADGHADLRRWTDPRTLQGFQHGTLIPLNQPSPANPDLDWLRARTTELR